MKRVLWLLGILVVGNILLYYGQEIYYQEDTKKMENLKSKLDFLRSEIGQYEVQLKDKDAQLIAVRNKIDACQGDIKGFERKAINKLLPPSIYQQYSKRVDTCNDLVKEHNKELGSLNSLSAIYEAKIEEHNGLVPNFNELAKATGTRWYLIPGLGRRTHTASHIAAKK